MKHTYLHPLHADELWLWRAARMDAGDLFGMPGTEDVDSVWSIELGISDALGRAREELHRRLNSRDRICVGRHYVIPGTLDEGAQDRARSADVTVHGLTRELWDAPVFTGDVYTKVYLQLERTAGRDGRDTWAEMLPFLRMYGFAPAEPWRVVPVWM